MGTVLERLSAETLEIYPARVTIPVPNNGHVHLRDTAEENDGRAGFIIPLLARTYGHVMAIGNTAQPLTTPNLAHNKRRQWESLLPASSKLKISVAGLLTEETRPEEIILGYDQPEGMRAYDAMKMFLRSVSNSHGADVDDLNRVIESVRVMTHTPLQHRRKGPMPLMVHAERKYDMLTGLRIPILEREQYAVKSDVEYLFHRVPQATIIICHVSSASTIEMIRDYRVRGYDIYGEISPQYSRYTIDDLFEDGRGGTAMNAWRFCLPCFKTEGDRQAIESAMVSGEPYFYLACDDACHIDDPTQSGGVKINTNGIIVGGQTQLPEAVISYCIEVFAKHKALHHLPAFVSDIASKVFGWPASTTTVTYVHRPYVVEENRTWTVKGMGMFSTRVAMGGETRRYQPLEA